jgi:hypothetical protein
VPSDRRLAEEFQVLKFRSFQKVQATVLRSPISLPRKLMLSAVFGFLFVWGIVNWVCLRLDRVLFPAFQRIEVKAPIFIIAHPRSGTTLTHRLMLEDPGRYSFGRAYELLLPSILQKKIVRALGAIDRRWLGETLHGWVRSKEAGALGDLQDVHHFSLLEAEEDEFFYWMTFASGVSISLFPYVEEFREYLVFDQMSEELQREQLDYYHGCLQRQLYLDGEDKTFCGKNTTLFIHKIAALAERYPDARFIHIVRNPFEVAPSLLSLMALTWRQLGFPEDDVMAGCAQIHELNMLAYERAFEMLDALDKRRYCILDYREIASAPRRTMMETYAALGLEMTPAYEAILGKLEERARSHKSGHEYGLEEYALTEEGIRAAAPTVFERYSFD